MIDGIDVLADIGAVAVYFLIGFLSYSFLVWLFPDDLDDSGYVVGGIFAPFTFLIVVGSIIYLIFSFPSRIRRIEENTEILLKRRRKR